MGRAKQMKMAVYRSSVHGDSLTSLEIIRSVRKHGTEQ
jgi:hypothetical protein